jgi:hypothetical protein
LDQALPKDLQEFLSQHISSVVQVELLLLLHGSAPREWPAGAIARELRIEPGWARTQAQDLSERGLLESRSESGQVLFRFQPADPALAAAVGRLADAYTSRRVSIISFIYSRPIDQLKSFSDAFRLRKEKPDG